MSELQQKQYNIARLPIDAAVGTAKALFWPLHFGKTVATNVVDTGFKLIGTNTQDVPAEVVPAGKSIHDMATSNLNIASMIYYYTELRVRVKDEMEALAKKKNLSTKNLCTLRDALVEVEGATKVLDAPEPTDKTAALKEYQLSKMKLKNLCKSPEFKLDDVELDIFRTYFDILREPKDMAQIHRDLVLYDKVIDFQFRLAIGGADWNRKNVEAMIEADKKAIGEKPTYIHHIDDDFATSSFTLEGYASKEAIDNELVWAIVVTPREKKITVVFRGSMNIMDWITNLKLNTTDCLLPGHTSKDDKGKKTTYGLVHRGFYNYLFGETKAGQNGSTKSKGEEIMGMLRGDFFDKPEFKDYNLEVTGHSLGGAMSTLFAFRAATENIAHRPDFCVTNVSVASPYVGDDAFRKEFIKLEKAGKMRHLRLSNYQDVVTLIPSKVFPLPNLNDYKHVGMNIRLYEGGDLLAPSYRRFYPKEGSFLDGARNTLHASLTLGLSPGVIGFHLCPEYYKRLKDKDTKEELSKLTLEGLYQDKSITGWE